MIDAGGKTDQVPANQIEFDFIERTSTGGGAEIDLAAGILSRTGDARREIEELRQCFKVRRPIAACSSVGSGSAVDGWRDDVGDRGKGGDSRLAHLGRHARRLEGGIDLEGQGLVIKVEEMGVTSDADIGMLGCIVIIPGYLRIVVAGHGRGRLSAGAPGWSSLTMMAYKPTIKVGHHLLLLILTFFFSLS